MKSPKAAVALQDCFLVLRRQAPYLFLYDIFTFANFLLLSFLLISRDVLSFFTCQIFVDAFGDQDWNTGV